MKFDIPFNWFIMAGPLLLALLIAVLLPFLATHGHGEKGAPQMVQAVSPGCVNSTTCVQVFEGIMLLCFGISWPVDIVNTLRIKQASGKSLAFMGLILVGYFAGITAKLVKARGSGAGLEMVTWLYVINTAFVLVDIYLTRRYRRRAGVEAR